jgi:hypothetical protein
MLGMVLVLSLARAGIGDFSVFSVLKISPKLGKAFNTEGTEKFKKINQASVKPASNSSSGGKTNERLSHQ